MISGWALSSPIGINSEGVLNNSALSYYPSGVVPEGVNFAWSNGGTISQVLANTLQPGDYSLKVYVGLRADLPPTWPGYAVQLYAGDHLLGQESILTPAGGTFALSTVNYHATGTNLYPGQALEIRLVSNGSQVSFDKVTLDYVPLPPTVNLAPLHGVASANATYDVLYPALVIDANWETQWAGPDHGTPENPFWLQVDLQKRYMVDQIILVFSHNPSYPGYTNVYNLYTSADGINWNLVRSGTLVDSLDPAVYVTTIPLAANQIIRYARYEVVGGTHWANIFEMEIWGDPIPFPRPIPLSILLLD